MPVFAYAGRGVAGQTARGELNASDRDAAIVQLRSQGVTVATIEEKKKSKAFGEKKQKITDKDLVVFTRQFATMIDAGLPLVQCLEILSAQADNKTLGKLLNEVIPIFAKMFSDFGGSLPGLTQFVIDLSMFMQKTWWLMLIVGVGGGWLLKRYHSTPAGRLKIDGLALKMPVIGDLIRKISVSRF